MSGRARVGFSALAGAALALGGAVPSPHAAGAADLKIEVIGKGTVTGTGINCGLGSSPATPPTARSATTVTLTATPSPGWTFVRWEDAAGLCCGVTTCPVLRRGPPRHGDGSLHDLGRCPDEHVRRLARSPSNGQSRTARRTTRSTAPPPGSTVQPDRHPGVDDHRRRAHPTAAISSPAGGWGGACGGTSARLLRVPDRRTASPSARFARRRPSPLDGDGRRQRHRDAAAASPAAPARRCDAQEPPNSKVTLTATPAERVRPHRLERRLLRLADAPAPSR